MEGGGVRSRQKPTPIIPAHTGGPPRRNADRMAFDRQELKNLIIDYKGFGIVTLVRLLLFKSCRGFIFGVMGIMLIIGQWLGPVGFSAAKFVNAAMEWCQEGAGPWAKCVMSSVAMVYFARLSIAALSHKEKRPEAFDKFNMPSWWPLYRHIDLVITSLFYDTCIYVVNLLIVFTDATVVNMVIDVLALEFFTLIDDEFKKSLLEYDDSFLDDMLHKPYAGSVSGQTPAVTGWQASPPGGNLTETLFDVNQVDVEADRQLPRSTRHPESQGFCCDAFVGLAKIPLMILRLLCRIGGPLFAFFMIGYGPYCLSAGGLP